MASSWLLQSTIGVIKTVAFLYDLITYPVYVVLQRPWTKLANSRRVKAISTSGHPEGPYVSTTANEVANRQFAAFQDCDSMFDVFESSVKINSHKHLLGTREVLNEEDEIQSDGKIFKKFVLGDYHWQSYDKIRERVVNVSKALQQLGLNPGHNVVIFAETRAEWMIACIACFRNNLTISTLYATLGEDALVHGINETEARLVVTSQELFPKLKGVLNKTPGVSDVICMEGRKKVSLEGFPDNVKYHSFCQVELMGSNSSQDECQPPKGKDIAVIMYTSGSTGIPKGVMISHNNLLHALKGISHIFPAKSDDVYLAYLPLAHVLELLTEFMCLVWGTCIAYSSPLTISDQSSKVKKGCRGDASVAKPTFMAAVPLILDRMHKSVTDVVSSRGAFFKAFFDFAYEYKLAHLSRGFGTPVLDRYVFKKIGKMLGGRLRAIVVGGAPLSPDTQNFIRVCLSCPVLQGYGLTETCVLATVTSWDDLTVGRVGAPHTGCEVMLRDWEEGNYRVSDKPHPRGELLIGGNHVTVGYYKDSSKTKEGYMEWNGKQWFCSGDIGEVHQDGCVKIIDRKKDIVKLQAGEYVSLGKVEAELKTLDIVDNVCVYASSFKTYAVALIVPNRKCLLQVGRDLGKGEMSFEQLCADRDVAKAVEQQIAQHGRRVGLERFEVPFRVKLVTEVWLPDTNFATAAYKLKRKNIEDFYQKDIDVLYTIKSS